MLAATGWHIRRHQDRLISELSRQLVRWQHAVAMPMEQQEQSAINAAVVPAEVAALISRTTESNTLRVPQYLHDALHELVGGGEAGRVKVLRADAQSLTSQLKKMSRTAGRGGSYVLDKGTEQAAVERRQDALVKRFMRDAVNMPFMDLDMDLEAAMQGVLNSTHIRHGGRRGARNAKSGLVPRGGARGPLYTEEYVVAYLASRFSGCYSSAWTVLDQLRWRLGGWAPRSMLDVGSGPGTAIWAAAEVWPDQLQQVVAMEPSGAMASVGFQLQRRLQQLHRSRTYPTQPPIPPVRWAFHLPGPRRADPLRPPPRYDLVMAAYMLGELPDDVVRQRVVADLWARTGDVLVLIEPGTPVGNQRMLAARTAVLAMGDCHVVAPCPHDGACPMQGTKGWCHFSQRFERSKLQREIKNVPGPKGPRSFQDERYSYVVLRRGPRPFLGHHTLLTPSTVLPVETIRRMRNVVVGGVDEDDLALSNVVASYEAPELGMGDWDAGMADQLSLEGTAWLKEATEQLQQQDAEFSTAMLQELLTHTALGQQGGGQDAEEDAEVEGDADDAMDPVVEALICESILSDEEEPASGGVVQASTLTDPALVAKWQEERAIEAASMGEGPDGILTGLSPALQMTDLTDPRPGAASIETPLDDTEEEITLRELFPKAFATTLEDAGQWSRIVRHVRKRRKHVVLDLCSAAWAPYGSVDQRQGRLVRQVVRKRDKEGTLGPAGYRLARKARWGDLWPMFYQRTTGQTVLSVAPGDEEDE